MDKGAICQAESEQTSEDEIPSSQVPEPPTKKARGSKSTLESITEGESSSRQVPAKKGINNAKPSTSNVAALKDEEAENEQAFSSQQVPSGSQQVPTSSRQHGPDEVISEPSKKTKRVRKSSVSQDKATSSKQVVSEQSLKEQESSQVKGQEVTGKRIRKPTEKVLQVPYSQTFLWYFLKIFYSLMYV